MGHITKPGGIRWCLCHLLKELIPSHTLKHKAEQENGHLPCESSNLERNREKTNKLDLRQTEEYLPCFSIKQVSVDF